jgi:hypothetical protein
MSAVLTPAAPTAARAPALKVTQARVLLSEFTKSRSPRSTMYTLLTAVALMIGLPQRLRAAHRDTYPSRPNRASTRPPADLASVRGYSAWIQLTRSSRLTVSSRAG